MAFQLSKLASRVSVWLQARVLEKQTRARGVNLLTQFHSAVNSPPRARSGVNIAARSENFSSSCSVTSKWCERKRVSVPTRVFGRKRVSVSTGVFSRKRALAVLLGTVGVSAAALSSSAVCAMAARSPLNLDSDKSDWKEAKSEFLCVVSLIDESFDTPLN